MCCYCFHPVQTAHGVGCSLSVECKEEVFKLCAYDLSTVSAFADSIAVMYKGIIAETGSVHQVLSPPSHPYTDLLISSVPELRAGWLEEADQNIQDAKIFHIHPDNI